MDWVTYQNKFWSKYLYLENRVLETSNYVTLDESNFNVFSHAFEELLVGICTEIESVFAEWSGKKGNIHKYIENIMCSNIDEFNIEISVLFSEIKLKPFEDLANFVKSQQGTKNKCEIKTHLIWWYIYNKIKHDKLNFYQFANLKNVLNALSALFILENLRIKKIGEDEEKANKADVKDCPYKPSILLKGEFNTKQIVIGPDIYATIG